MKKYLNGRPLLLAAWAVILVITYQLAFKKTMEAWRLRRDLKGQVAVACSTNLAPGYMARKNRNLDNLLSLYRSDSVNFRSNTIGRIAGIAENDQVKLSEVPLEDQPSSDGATMIQKLGFEGDYFSLMRVFRQLGKMQEAGLIRSATLKVKPRQDQVKSKKMIMELYFERENK